MRRLWRGLVAVVAGVSVGGVALCGCGSSSDQLEVSAASSLKPALTLYGQEFGATTYSFGGSDQLAAQIRAGARPDVFLAANGTIPQALYASRLVQRPVPFASNALVLAVPVRSRRIRQLSDLTAPGVTVATGSPTVPVGAYTLTVLGRLRGLGRAIKARVRSQEPDDAGIVGKLLTGAVDAGFVYQTDVTASRGALRAVALPPSAKPLVTYEGAVVVGASQSARARRFLAGLVSGNGAADLAAAGFGPPR